MRKFTLAVAATVAMMAASPASASHTIFYTGGPGVGDSSGRQYSSNGMNMQVTAWQVNQSTGIVNSASLGSYSGGLGVTGLGDNGGAGALHQFDNKGGYTDFVLLQFDQIVTLDYLYLNSYYFSGQSYKDNDFATYALTPTGAAWNSDIDLGGSNYDTSFWTTVWNNNGGASGWYDTNNPGASNLWLVAAGPDTYFNDGFKLKKVAVKAAVPEPTTWLMMLLGFGTMGMALKRRRRSILADLAIA